MSSAMISSVLGIEREAEAILAKSEGEAAEVVRAAQARRESEAARSLEDVKRAVARLEEEAKTDREMKTRELAAAGDAALSAVRNVSDAAFDNAVQYIMMTLNK